MGKYFVRYFIETPNSIGNRKDTENGKSLAWKFNFDNNEISLYNRKEGLFADCYINAGSLEESEEKSMIFFENVLNLIDFSTSSASSPLLFINAYDASPNLKERKFKQIFYVPIKERNVVPINEEIFGEVFRVFNQNKDERIARAISWLRKGYLEPKYIDKFVAFWTGLEVINELLCNFFQISKEERKFKCPKCGCEISTISSIGIEKLFIKELNIDKDLFGKIRKQRGKLLHGGGPLDHDFIDEINRYNSITRKALIIGIGKLLQINDETIENIIQQKSRIYNEKIRVIVRAVVSNLYVPKLEEFGKQPRLDLSEQNLLERLVDEKGKLNLKVKSNLIAQNATFNNISFELWGDDNSALENAQFIDIK
jgi:hypothetical protein